MDGVGIGRLGAYFEQSGTHLAYAVGINGASKVWTLDTLERRRGGDRSRKRGSVCRSSRTWPFGMRPDRAYTAAA